MSKQHFKTGKAAAPTPAPRSLYDETGVATSGEAEAEITLPTDDPNALFTLVQVASESELESLTEHLKVEVRIGDYILVEVTDETEPTDLLWIVPPAGAHKFECYTEEGEKALGRVVEKCKPLRMNDGLINAWSN